MKVINILLVDDDHLDALDIARSLDKMQIIYKMNIARNGEEAIRLLEENDESGTPYPDLLLIDLNMPRMNGLELLQVLRNSVKWQQLKCFVITTSEEWEDKKAARDLGISGYIVKPLKLNNPSSIDAFNLMIDLMNM
ncbi:MAG: response regulator receiver protein [Ferruginibacter sp.]|nr:response regulator receiver protein [Ferruginibacter sp.]